MSTSESPLLDDVSLGILETGYMERCVNKDELVAALDVAPVDLDRRIAALIAGGFITEADGNWSWASPYTAFLSLGAARVRRMNEELERTTALMYALPRLIRAWGLSEVDEDGEHPLTVNIISSTSDAGDAWFNHARVEQPVNSSMIYPEAEPLLAALRCGHLEELQRRVSSGSVRVLLNASAECSPELAELVSGAREIGIDFRRSRVTPSWMYVDPGRLVGVPVLWGSSAPKRTLAIRTPPVVAAMALAFDQLWAMGERWDPTDAPWAPILAMLSRGITDDAIANRLGLTDRTVRRRIAEAMDEFGVNSRFALGMAWQRMAGD